ncbi:porin [Paraburkholderia acidisoli]|uniref:Porin n=1 Tax=Paraburkholderia acidisoli TaxID=2571748 RepID=A0A7Z2GQR4_9BURK|nr:porin [Paraburkholderia acidisoli]QGZ66150.1 porin [Paraburkholderia acidisoli]
MLKKCSFAGAVAVLLGSQVAHAQGSLTLYGIIDEGVTWSSNQKGHSAVQLQSGKLGGSRWGLRGEEPLGNGLSAIMNLENGFNATNGTNSAGREFARAALVGLSKKGLGSLTFGRQADSLADIVAPFFGAGYFTPATHIGDNDDMNWYWRVNNSVKVTTESLSGFKFSGIYGFSNQAGAFANNREWSAAASYANGPLSFGAGYMQINHPNATTNTSGALGGASTANGDDYGSAFFYGMDGGVARQQVAGAGAGYALGAAQIGIGFTNVQLDYNDGASRKLNNASANVRYRLNPALALIADYTFTYGTADHVPGSTAHLKPRWHQLTLGVDYSVSKRTEFYASAEYQLAAGDASIVSGGTLSKIAYIQSAGGASSSDSQVAVSVGIRHKF